MTEDLITDLSRLSGVFVISRNSSWTYKGRSVKPQQVAEQLGVRYLLEGSVRRQGDMVRINAQLIDAIGGHHVWADRYDGTLDDVFALQDQVIGEIVSALAVNLTTAEKAEIEAAETRSTQAYDAVLQGMQHLRPESEAPRALLLPQCFQGRGKKVSARFREHYKSMIYLRNLVAWAGFEPATFRL
ncbi:MAG TPA: hypothetical protein VMM59_06040 [Thermohalobaculum sp.]|nr:hypothetical protein [Thermohalobaculum sp.]